MPRIPLIASLTADDLLPLVGLGLLALRTPFPRLTADRWARAALLAIAIATVARIASALANGGGLEGTFLMLVQAIARPAVLLGIAVYAAASVPEDRRHRAVIVAIAAVGTYEAAFGLLAFMVPLPGNAGLQAARELTSVYGVCRGLISGTLGLSANHLGALFVLSLPLTVSLAIKLRGWPRWGWTLAASAQSAALVLTFTRSSILLGVLLSAAFVVYERRFLTLAVIAAGATVLVVTAMSLGCAGSPATTPGSVLGARFSDGNDRLALWYAAGRLMVDHPLYGVGLGRMLDAVEADPNRYQVTPFGSATSSAHNTILLAGAETGVLGGLAVASLNVLLVLIALRCARRGRARGDPLLVAAGLVILGYLAQGMVNNLFSIPATSSLLALLVGAFALPRAESSDTSSPVDSALDSGPIPPSSYTPTPVDEADAAGASR